MLTYTNCNNLYRLTFRTPGSDYSSVSEMSIGHQQVMKMKTDHNNSPFLSSHSLSVILRRPI